MAFSIRSLLSAVFVFALVGFTSPALAGPEDGLFQAAKLMYDTKDAEDDAAKRTRLTSVRSILDQIVVVYPDTELAAQIKAGAVVDGIDIGAMDRFLSGETVAAETEEPAKTAASDAATTTQPTAGEDPNTAAGKEALPSDLLAAVTDLFKKPEEETQGDTADAKEDLPADVQVAVATKPKKKNGGGQAKKSDSAATTTQDDSDTTNPFASTDDSEETTTAETDSTNPFASTDDDSSGENENPFGSTDTETANKPDDQNENNPFGEDGNGTSNLPVATLPANAEPGTQFTEAALGLSRAERRELQTRLNLLGYNVGAADGALGRKSRTAIGSWQSSNGALATGYLSAIQWEVLRAQSEIAYRNNDSALTTTTKKKRKKRRVKVCRKTGLGVRLCKYVYR
ncbi:MAG: peptidoglycan-binding domain-containing protein [Pseudomonadota bacterium]